MAFRKKIIFYFFIHLNFILFYFIFWVFFLSFSKQMGIKDLKYVGTFMANVITCMCVHILDNLQHWFC